MNKICGIIIKYHIFLKKALVLSITCSTCYREDEKILLKEESMEKTKKTTGFDQYEAQNGF